MKLKKRMQSRGEELANSVSHGAGLLLALLSAPILIALTARAGSLANVVGAAIFAGLRGFDLSEFNRLSRSSRGSAQTDFFAVSITRRSSC